MKLANVHLESTKPSASIRAKQLSALFPILDISDTAIILGDFNFCSSWTENQNIHPNYKDIWNELRPDQMGYTEDTEVNTTLFDLKRKKKQVRFDGILLRVHI